MDEFSYLSVEICILLGDHDNGIIMYHVYQLPAIQFLHCKSYQYNNILKIDPFSEIQI